MPLRFVTIGGASVISLPGAPVRAPKPKIASCELILHPKAHVHSKVIPGAAIFGADAYEPLCEAGSMKRSLWVCTVIAIASLTTGACSGSSSTAGDSTPGSTVATVETSVAAETRAPAESSAPAETRAPVETSEPTSEQSTPVSELPADEPATTEALIFDEPGTANSPTLAADSPTCKAFTTVKEMNDLSGELTSNFQAKIAELGAGLNEPTPEYLASVSKEWDTFRTGFSARSDELIGKLQGAYATLSKEQPQFAADFANISEVTSKFLGVFAELSFEELPNVQDKLTGAISTDKMTAAGQSSLKIDTFSKEACGIAFANT
jgi:hypothetical protein